METRIITVRATLEHDSTYYRTAQMQSIACPDFINEVLPNAGVRINIELSLQPFKGSQVAWFIQDSPSRYIDGPVLRFSKKVTKAVLPKVWHDNPQHHYFFCWNALEMELLELHADLSNKCRFYWRVSNAD